MAYPKTLEEAQKIRYNQWSGNPKGRKYRLGGCAYELFNTIPSHQCSRRAKVGPGGLYCVQHAKGL